MDTTKSMENLTSDMVISLFRSDPKTAQQFNLPFQKQEDVQEKLKNEVDKIPVNEMTSRDYYFDSYAHFGIHEG